MRTKEEFIETILTEIKTYLPTGEYSIECAQINKNNGYQDALIIREAGKNISPTLYIDALYDEYLRTESIETVLRHIAEGYQREIPFQINSVNDVIDKPVFVTIVNKEANTEMLSDCPHIEYGDLALLAKIQVIDDGTITITNEILNAMGISAAELFDKAIRYTKENRAPLVSSIGDKLMGLGNDYKMSSPEELSELDVSEQMFVITNNSQLFGSSALVFQDQIENLATALKGDIYLLPSSIHELICVSIDAPEQEYLLEMVKSINETEVAREDFLSDSVYKYKAATKELYAISQDGQEIKMELKGLQKELEKKHKKKYHR